MMSGEAITVPSNLRDSSVQVHDPISNPNPTNPNPNSSVKRKRRLPGTPDPNAEVIALSPKSLMATNRFICEVCNKGFQRDQNLQLHRRGHNLPWKLRQRSKEEVRKKVYVCPEKSCVHHDPCRALGDLTGIKKHFSRKHGEKKWKCEKCSKKYAVQSDWKAHNKICGTRQYKCDCGTIFSRKDSFVTHRAFCDAMVEQSGRLPAILSNLGNDILMNAQGPRLMPQGLQLHGFHSEFGGPGSESYMGNFADAEHVEHKLRLPIWLDQTNLQLNHPLGVVPGNSSVFSTGTTLPETNNMFGTSSSQAQWTNYRYPEASFRSASVSVPHGLKKGVGGGTKKKKKKKSKKSSFFPRFGCFRIEHDVSGGGFDIEVVDESGQRPTPTHLIIMVNGLVGSAQNWKFAAKQLLKRFPEDAVVHCSERNSSMLTFDGVDVMGDRLAEEVISVIKRHPSVQKISFVGHSLGGLIARYAIARLYGRDISVELSVGNGHCESHVSDQECHDRKYEGKIAGLEPINFITSATPHLGSRGHKQVPMFCGFYSLEKAVSRVAGVFGKTGKHLFLTDSDNGKPPLLLQMVRDSEDIKFLSALRSFKRRIAYANVRYDQLVGWSTSSLRRRKELPKRRHLSRHEKYPHIVNVETAKSSCVAEEVPAESKLSSESSKLDSEEEMIRSLTAMSWDRIDVSFSGSRQKYLAHSTIQVNTYCINSDGADVIQHMVDSFQI